jgi:hypothetical protein
MAGLKGKSGPPGNMNAFKHGLAAIQKRREESVITEHEENNDPFLLKSRQPVERLFVQMSLAPAAVPQPRLILFPSLGGWDHYSASTDMSTSAGPSHIGVEWCAAGDSTRDR